MYHEFFMWVRGLEVKIVGEIEPADRDVGIMGDTFIMLGALKAAAEQPHEGHTTWFVDAFYIDGEGLNGPRSPGSKMDKNLSDGEIDEITSAFWAQAAPAGHCVFSYDGLMYD